MLERKVRRGLATLCVSGGVGMALKSKILSKGIETGGLPTAVAILTIVDIRY
jgi:hypothetical protein